MAGGGYIKIHWQRVGLILMYAMFFVVFVMLRISDEQNLVNEEEENESNQTSSRPMRQVPKPSGQNCSYHVPVPSYVDINVRNLLWQQVNDMDIYLYSAYYDRRLEHSHGATYVRVLGMKDICNLPRIYCQLWYKDKREPFVIEARQQWMWFNCKLALVPNEYHGVMYTCPLPRKQKSIPSHVSLTPLPCHEATTLLAVRHIVPKKKQDFAVCVKGLNFLYADNSFRFVEWLEMQLLLGAKKVFLYKYDVTYNLAKILTYYIEKGVVDVTPLTLPGVHPNDKVQRYVFVKENEWQSWLMEVLVYTDCLYRNLYSYKYLAVVDLDEFVIPVKHRTWGEMMHQLWQTEPKFDQFASYSFRNAYFLDQFFTEQNKKYPKFAHALQHVNRSKKLSPKGEDVKSFVNTDGALTVHNHWPLHLMPGYEPVTFWVDADVAKMHHYRGKCTTVNETACDRSYTEQIVEDLSIYRYGRNLARNMIRTLTEVGYISRDENAGAKV